MDRHNISICPTVQLIVTRIPYSILPLTTTFVKIPKLVLEPLSTSQRELVEVHQVHGQSMLMGMQPTRTTPATCTLEVAIRQMVTHIIPSFQHHMVMVKTPCIQTVICTIIRQTLT